MIMPSKSRWWQNNKIWCKNQPVYSDYFSSAIIFSRRFIFPWRLIFLWICEVGECQEFWKLAAHKSTNPQPYIIVICGFVKILGVLNIPSCTEIHKYTNFEFIVQILNIFWICVSFSLRVIYRPSPKIHLAQVPPLSRRIVILAFLDPCMNSTWSSVKECYLFLTVDDHEKICDLCNLCIPKFAPRRFWMKPNLGFVTWILCICDVTVGAWDMAVGFFVYLCIYVYTNEYWECSHGEFPKFNFTQMHK